MAFGKSFSTAKSSIKEKSLEYLRNVTNRSAAEPQDRKRVQPTTPPPLPDRTPTSTSTLKKPILSILSTPPSTLRSKPSPKDKRNASSSSILKDHQSATAANEKQKGKQKENENEKQKQDIPHTDPLPYDKLELEGLKNNLVSQLQKLADRVESINEWMEMDAIKLARMVEVAGRDDSEGKREFYAPPQRTKPDDPGPSSQPPHLHARPLRTPNTTTAEPPVSLTMHEGRLVDKDRYFMSRQERVDGNCAVRELQTRIRNMRRWRRELEVGVGWVREEMGRVCEVGGWVGEVGDGDGDGDGGEGEEGEGKEEKWGIGGWRWVKGCGRVPTAREWKALFSNARIWRVDGSVVGGKGYYQ